MPKVYDVLLHEGNEIEKHDKETKSQLTIFIVMEHFDTDLKQFINKKIKDLDDS